MPNGKCRIHGGKSLGSPKGTAAANYRNGRWTQEAIAERRELSALMLESRELMRELR